jgi:hypothetical protein
MKPADDIKRLIKQSHITTGPKADERILAGALTDLSQLKQKRSAVTSPNVWRIFMKSKMTKLATAAVIIAAVTSALWHHTGSMDLATTALAQALENMQGLPWVRMKAFEPNEDRDKGDEFWIGFASQVGLTKRRTGEIEYVDLASRTEFKYDPVSKVATLSYLHDHIEPLNVSRFSYASIEEVKKSVEEGAEVTKARGEYQGKIVDIYEISGRNQTFNLHEKIFVSLQTHLPIAAYGSLLGDVIEFEYPGHGPGSVYDVVLPASIDMSTDLLELVQGYHTYKKNAPDKYIAVVTTSSSESDEGKVESVRIIFRDGHLMRTQYREAKEYNAWQDYLSQMGLSFDSLYTWWANDENSEITDVYLYDGKNDYYVSLSEMSENYQIAGRDPNHAGLDEMGWPDIGIQFGHRREARIVETAYSRDNGLLGIEVLRPGKVDTTGKRVTLPERVLCYLDPTRDYICQRMETESVLGATWHQDQAWLDTVDANDIPMNSTVISEVFECVQTDTGQWYPKIIRSVVLKDEQKTEDSVLRIYMRSNTEFPDGVFDRKVWP